MGWRSKGDPAVVNDPTYLEPRITAVEIEQQGLAIKKPSFLELTMRGNKNRFLAHRGATGLYPENTLIAFEKSCQLGYFGIELDVFETSDGVWVVMHDDTVDRTTNGTGAVSSFTLAQIKTLIIDAGTNVARYPNMKVPTLEDVLKMCAQYNTIPCIEIKSSTSAGYDSFVSLIREYGFEEKCIVICFTRSVLQEIRNRSQKIPVMLNEPITSESIAWLSGLGNAVISTWYGNVTKELVKEAHENNVVVASYPADTFDIVKQQFDLGVDLITIDKLIF